MHFKPIIELPTDKFWILFSYFFYLEKLLFFIPEELFASVTLNIVLKFWKSSPGEAIPREESSEETGGDDIQNNAQWLGRLETNLSMFSL